MDVSRLINDFTKLQKNYEKQSLVIKRINKEIKRLEKELEKIDLKIKNEQDILRKSYCMLWQENIKTILNMLKGFLL